MSQTLKYFYYWFLFSEAYSVNKGPNILRHMSTWQPGSHLIFDEKWQRRIDLQGIFLRNAALSWPPSIKLSENGSATGNI